MSFQEVLLEMNAPTPVVGGDKRVDASVAYRIILPLFALIVLAFIIYFLFSVPNEIIGVAALFPPVPMALQKSGTQ